MSNILTKAMKKKVSRRTFIKVAAVTGGAAATSGILFSQIGAAQPYGETLPDPVSGTDVKVIRTGCMGCNAFCGVSVKVVNNVVEKIGGNPYCFNTNDIDAAGTEVAYSDITNPAQIPAGSARKENPR